jgi:hypothetical protein
MVKVYGTVLFNVGAGIRVLLHNGAGLNILYINRIYFIAKALLF